MALTAVTARGMIEYGYDEQRDAEDHRRQLCDWVDSVGIAVELEPREDSLIRTPIGQLDQQDAADAQWRSEGVVVLGWSIGRVPLPRYDEQWDSFEVAKALGFLRERSATALAAPTLRARAEIEQGANTYLTVRWRLRQYPLSRTPIDFASYVSQCKWGPLSLSEVTLVDGDLGIQGERLDRIPEDWYHRALSIAWERQRAFNWLLGFHQIYSRVETPT
jgi:hypothetical protein